VLFLLSLTGLPPTAGFIGKLLIFGYLIKGGYFGIALAFVGVIFSAISLYYYAKIFAAMFLRTPPENLRPIPEERGAMMPVLWLLGGATLGLGIFWQPIYQLALQAGRGLL
jgi:NADH-quinone oxidoreductase subunit N